MQITSWIRTDATVTKRTHLQRRSNQPLLILCLHATRNTSRNPNISSTPRQVLRSDRTMNFAIVFRTAVPTIQRNGSAILPAHLLQPASELRQANTNLTTMFPPKSIRNMAITLAIQFSAEKMFAVMRPIWVSSQDFPRPASVPANAKEAIA
jgi:hypothetical protein